jgi:hypothetical protein
MNNDWKPTPQTPEQVADGLRNAFRQAKKDGVMDATPYLKQMTFKSDIEKTEAEIKVLEKKLELLKEIETHKSQPIMVYVNEGGVEIVSYNDKVYYRLDLPDEVYWYISKRDDNGAILLKQITDGETRRLLEGVWFNDVKKGKYDADEPEHYDEVEWDEKDNPKPMDEVVDRLVKKYQAQKLWNRVRDELGYSIDCCDEIVDLVESWIPKEQNASGSQNVNTELLVEGFNDAIRKMKEMLR